MCLVVPCRVTRLLPPAEIEVDRLGVRLRVATFLLDEMPAIGDWVAVQAQRQAVARLDAAEAHELLALYEDLVRHMEAPAA